ncbi:MAG: DUF3006 domain-containing protein [Patescibacteria group bacterium]
MSKHLDDDFVRVELTLDRIEGELAVLVNAKSTFDVPVKYLPKNTKEGDIVYLILATSAGERRQREIKAKELLNEILRGE